MGIDGRNYRGDYGGSYCIPDEINHLLIFLLMFIEFLKLLIGFNYIPIMPFLFLLVLLNGGNILFGLILFPYKAIKIIGNL